jgi:hypothetical protein
MIAAAQATQQLYARKNEPVLPPTSLLPTTQFPAPSLGAQVQQTFDVLASAISNRRDKTQRGSLTRAGVCIADSRATIDARLAGFSRAAVPNGIFNVPNLDDLAGTHGSEQQKALSLTP